MRGSPSADDSLGALRPPAADDAPNLTCFVSFFSLLVPVFLTFTSFKVLYLVSIFLTA